MNFTKLFFRNFTKIFSLIEGESLMDQLNRNNHFLGTKLRNLRKEHRITLEELSSRCAEIDPQKAPSTSYLSMIENGSRNPSPEILSIIADIFQRPINWFLDHNTSALPSAPKPATGGMTRIPFDPAFLFTKDLLQAAIPELLLQTGTTGRQFAHLLIRSHQETSHNEYPDLERMAEKIGNREFPLSVDRLMTLCKQHGLEIRWFERKPVMARDKERSVKSVIRSFYEPPGIIYLNKALEKDPARLKFDLASHLGHKVLHGGDGLKSVHATGGEFDESPDSGLPINTNIDASDVLLAWRDFECSFFAGALLCPKIPFRRFLTRERHRLEAGKKIELTPAAMMRRMTKVSNYPHWHFFDATSAGRFRAVYRGNGIPLPWGNMTEAKDPCPNWAVFRMTEKPLNTSSSQLSVIRENDEWQLYCCHTLHTKDMSGLQHVLSVGVNLGPALISNDANGNDIVQGIGELCVKKGGEAKVGVAAANSIRAIANILSIGWIEDALAQPARIICPRSLNCPRDHQCNHHGKSSNKTVEDIKKEILIQTAK